MNSPKLPEALELITAISGDFPCGEDMSFSNEFDAIQEARREDDPSLDQGEWITSIKEADWKLSAEICRELLLHKTKDLRLGSWLTEAQAMTHGVVGMAQGFELLAGLAETFWSEIHPQSEDGDHEQRIGNLRWLVTRCIGLTREFPVVRNKGRQYTLGELETARAQQNTADRGQYGNESGGERITLQQIRDTQRSTPRAYYEQLLADTQHCLQSLGRFAAVIDDRLGMDGPSFTPLRNALENYESEIERIARENGISAPAEVPHAAPPRADAAAPGAEAVPVPAQPTGPLQSREQALRQLRDVAEFFRRTEPHSPVAYLAEKAANWGEMPLHVWLKAVLKEEGALSRFEDLLGFENSEEE